MKSRTVNTITSNEEYVRLRIYEGEIPLEEGGAELIRIARAQVASAEARLRMASIWHIVRARARSLLRRLDAA